MWARILLVPIIQAVGSVAKPGGWVNPRDKGENRQDKNRMMIEETKNGRGTHRKSKKNASSSLWCGRWQADGSTEVVWINFETSSRYREYGEYSLEFHYQGFIFVSSGFRLDR